jgi:hypothetical protein
MSLSPERNPCYFEVRSMNKENCYKLVSLNEFTMVRLLQLVNIEHDQKFDYAIVKQLAKIIEFLPNLED